MKTRRLSLRLCSLFILMIAPEAFAHLGTATSTDTSPAHLVLARRLNMPDVTTKSTLDDPIGDWLEKNADRFGLYTDSNVRGKDLGGRTRAPTKSAPVPRDPGPVAAAPSAAASSPQASEASQAMGIITPSIAIKGVVELPGGANLIHSPIASCGEAACFGDSPLADGIVNTLSSDYVVDRKAFVPPTDATTTANAAAQISAVMKDLRFGNKCSGFATSTGFGAWGKAVIKELIYGNANSLLQGTDDLRRACPNYDFLTIPEKSHVWVNVLASMSFLESSCDPSVEGEGPDGKAVGLMQLHAGQEHAAAPGCNRNDSRAAISSLRCTISIIEAQIKRTSALFSRDTHFGVLRPQGDLIRTRTGALKRVVKARIVVGGIKELPFCRRN